MSLIVFGMEDPNLDHGKRSILTVFDHLSYDSQVIQKFQEIEAIYFKEQPSIEEIDFFISTLGRLAHQNPPFPPALYVLGMIRLYGWQTVLREVSEAKKFLSRASYFGYPPAKYQLGLLYIEEAAELQDFKDFVCQWCPAAHILNLLWQFPPQFDGLISLLKNPQSAFYFSQDMQPLNETKKILRKIENAIQTNDIQSVYALFKIFLADMHPSTIIMLIQDPCYDILCTFAESNTKIRALLGRLWKEIIRLPSEQRAIIIDVRGADCKNTLKYCKEQAYNNFIGAALNGDCVSWIAVGQLIEENNAPKYVRRQAAACFYKAYTLTQEKKIRNKAVQHLLALAHVDDNQPADIQSVIRLILISKQDGVLDCEIIKKIIDKILGLPFEKKRSLIPAIKKDLKIAIDTSGDYYLYFLYGKLLQHIRDLQNAHLYLQVALEKNIKGALQDYVKVLIEQSHFEQALDTLEKFSAPDALKGNEQQKINMNLLEKLKKLARENSRCALLLYRFYKEGIFLDKDEDCAELFLNLAIKQQNPDALLIRLQRSEERPAHEVIFDLLALLGTQWHTYAVEKISALLESEILPLETYYSFLKEVIAYDACLALHAFREAEKWLRRHKDTLSQEASQLIYSSGAYDVLDISAKENTDFLKELAQMHLWRAENNYGLKSTLSEEWKTTLSYCLQLLEKNRLPEDWDLNWIKFQFVMCDEAFQYEESSQYVEEMQDEYPPAKIVHAFFSLRGLTKNKNALERIENIDVEEICRDYPDFTNYFSYIFHALSVYYYNQKAYETSLKWCERAAYFGNNQARDMRIGIENFMALESEQDKISQQRCDEVFDLALQFYDLGNYDKALQFFQEVTDTKKTHAAIYIGMIHALKKNMEAAQDILETALESLIGQNEIRDDLLFLKGIDALGLLYVYNSEIGYQIARYRLLRGVIRDDFKEIIRTSKIIRKVEAACIAQADLSTNILESQFYATAEKFVREKNITQPALYEIQILLFWIHMNRAAKNMPFLETKEDHVERAKDICAQLERIWETEDQKKKLLDAFFDLSVFLSDTSCSLEEMSYLNKILDMNRFHEDALFERALRYLENPELYEDSNHVRELALNDLKILQKNQNTKAWFILARILLGEVEELKIPTNQKTVSEGIRLMRKLADLPIDDECVIQAARWLADCWISGRHFKKNQMKAIQYLKNKAKIIPSYRSRMMVDFICWAEKAASLEERQLFYTSAFEELEQINETSMETDLCSAKLFLTSDEANEKAYNLIEKYFTAEWINKARVVIDNLGIIDELERLRSTDLRALFLLSKFWCLMSKCNKEEIYHAENIVTQLYLTAKKNIIAPDRERYLFFSLLQMAYIRTHQARLKKASGDKIFNECKNALSRMSEALTCCKTLEEEQKVIFKTILRRILSNCTEKIVTQEYQKNIYDILIEKINPFLGPHEMKLSEIAYKFLKARNKLELT